ncbi:MAG: hypothetical protein OZ948_18450 [Deltaproteobacteria bacterium]|nr:hypothetical protein [Deltaproteobacteria bacterium]
MGSKRSSTVTPRQREWLGHLRKAAREKVAVRAYARRHRLSEHALYQAAKELRRKGHWAPSERARRARTARTQGRFVEVRAATAATVEPPSRWRAQLPNGVVVEGAGELAAALAMLARL